MRRNSWHKTLSSRALSRRYGSSTNIHGGHNLRSKLFDYTSGRWLYDENDQLRQRHLDFNVQALIGTASHELGSRCQGIVKLPEGLYNKVFSLQMEDGRDILARLPDPNAGYPDCIVPSEVATLHFLREILDIPVPKVLAWSSKDSRPDRLGAEYILMERVTGRQLAEVWDDMSEKERFGLTKSLVEIERRLLSVKFSAHGSIFYKETFPDGPTAVNPDQLPGPKQEAALNYVIGPTTERSFFLQRSQCHAIDRGPWPTAEEYLIAVANREKFLIENPDEVRLSDGPQLFPRGRTASRNYEHLQTLDRFLAILPHILPKAEITHPVLMHHDLHLDNIFVDATDPTKISGIIDWQATYASPLFLQARFPSVFNCDEPYPWGAVQPTLPEGFETFSPAEKKYANEALDRLRLKKFYEMASRKFNPDLFRAMDAMRNEADSTTYIFHIITRSASDGPIPLAELLLQIYEQWDRVVEGRQLDDRCPISFTEEEVREIRRKAEEWAAAYCEFESLRVEVAEKEGWVRHEEYEEAKERFDSRREELKELWCRLERVS